MLMWRGSIVRFTSTSCEQAFESPNGRSCVRDGQGRPEGYVQKSRELAEKKLAALYAGIVRMQSVGGVAKPTDPVGAVVMRLARMAIQKEKASDIAAASKEQRLALINRLAAEYAQSHDATLRPRAGKCRGRAYAGEKGWAGGQGQEGRLTNLQ
jgi:hypothetical protein